MERFAIPVGPIYPGGQSDDPDNLAKLLHHYYCLPFCKAVHVARTMVGLAISTHYPAPHPRTRGGMLGHTEAHVQTINTVFKSYPVVLLTEWGGRLKTNEQGFPYFGNVEICPRTAIILSGGAGKPELIIYYNMSPQPEAMMCVELPGEENPFAAVPEMMNDPELWYWAPDSDGFKLVTPKE